MPVVDNMNNSSSVVIRAFTLDQAERLTGITKSRLMYWDRRRFFVPEHADENRRVAFSRIYSFQDVVGLRVIKVLLTQYGISVQHLRKVGQELKARTGEVWANTKLYVVKKEVVFDDPETGKPRGVLSGQYVTPTILIEDMARDVSEDANKLLERSPETIGQIQQNRHIAQNSPVVAGTRIPTSAIKSFRDEGYSVEDILKQYPTLRKEDIAAALKFEEEAAA